MRYILLLALLSLVIGCLLPTASSENVDERSDEHGAEISGNVHDIKTLNTQLVSDKDDDESQDQDFEDYNNEDDGDDDYDDEDESESEDKQFEDPRTKPGWRIRFPKPRIPLPRIPRLRIPRPRILRPRFPKPRIRIGK